MKPSNGVEPLTGAWNRYVEIWKQTQRKRGSKNEIPVRIRGYSELRMGDIDPTERKMMHSAVLRGYKLAQNNRATQLLAILLQTVDYELGYAGKTQAHMWFPSKEARDDCLKHVEAMAVMTDKFNAHQSIRKWSDRTFQIYIPTNSWTGEQLKAHLTETRLVFDEHMAKWADVRQPLADKMLDDDWVCRIPFDSIDEEL